MRYILLVLILLAPAATAAPPVVPFRRAHAHNDYEHPRPLFDALDNGFCSVEADVFLTDAGLQVAHTVFGLKPGRTLESLYLKPLRERVNANGGRVYKDGPPFTLMIDVKTDAAPAWTAIKKQLADYADILNAAAVTVVISGHGDREGILHEAKPLAGLDGRPSDLDGEAPASRIPWISADWTSQFQWNGTGPMPDADRVKLATIVAKAHAQDRRVRFWGAPDVPAVWAALLAADVDLINTDKLVELRQFLIAAEKTREFDFGTNATVPQTYAKDRGFGFEPGAKVTIKDGVCTSDKPFHFSVAVPEGNYTVTVSFGDAASPSETTVKAELRRLMLETVATEPGQFATRSFTVNVRTTKIAAGGEVKLKEREKTTEAWAWDEKLTLEFNGKRPCVRSIRVEPADVPTIFLLGDSTVCDQPGEPYASWGQMLPRFFTAGVAVANHAESGESLKSSFGAKRIDKVLGEVKAGDCVFVQFGHNDMKAVTAEAYKVDLKRVVDGVRKAGGTPVLVTPVQRRSFSGTTITNSLKDFPDAVRSLAKEEAVPLIDLNATSKTLYEALGPDKSGLLFKTGDGTHHNNFGAYELAKCVVEGVRSNKLAIAKFIANDVKVFDPAKPDKFEDFRVPASPQATAVAPEGK